MKDNLSRRLTIRYCIYQLLFFSISAGTSGFGVTYLLEQGFTATQTGTIMSLAIVASCVIQPLLGDIFDRLKTFVLPKIVAAIFLCSFCCYAVMQIVHPALFVFGLLFGVGNLMLSITNSLNNSVCAYYTNRNYPINYGIGLGLGSLAYSFASLGYGYIIAAFGASAMIWIVLAMLVILVITVFGYPKVEDTVPVVEKQEAKELETRVSLLEFFGKYKSFTVTMFGVLLVAMCHTMSENYFITIFQSMGGGSEDVGIGLFVACLSATPFFLFFEKIREKVDIMIFLKTAGIFFMLKTLLLILATEVWHVYLIQLLQTVTYGFIYQPLYYFARQRVAQADLVKGQAVAVSMYLFGAALGGFAGGRALDAFGLHRMLMLALGIAFAGTVIINISLHQAKINKVN